MSLLSFWNVRQADEDAINIETFLPSSTRKDYPLTNPNLSDCTDAAQHQPCSKNPYQHHFVIEASCRQQQISTDMSLEKVPPSLPDWMKAEWKKELHTHQALTISTIKLNRVISDLENHNTLNTVPKSIQLPMNIRVGQAQQGETEAKVKEAIEICEKTILKSVIKARKDELNLKKQDAERNRTSFIRIIADRYTDLYSNNIISLTEEEIRTQIANVTHEIDIIRKVIEEQEGTKEYLERKKKVEADQKRQAAREEQRINETLSDPGIKELQDRIKKLEADSKKASNTPAKQGPKKNQKKGPGPSKKQGGGPKKGQEKGKQQQANRSTPSISRSGSKKKNSHPKRG